MDHKRIAFLKLAVQNMIASTVTSLIRENNRHRRPFRLRGLIEQDVDEGIEIALSRSLFPGKCHQLSCSTAFRLSVEPA